ncbi:bifunctional phosphopantothenoylcysteine decarboxylase/phosphopantothenate--cysteine ligase CoaBC [Candidatus Bathyarchaeota archaeon]|jgi:phosphopantothenoylcysteine decarboxylase / phosphopantothenate---cysteine ligase|nr:bifunctional phosphopantothenoylcysteine decarboxylase/phosphopantothenate--cysteine ligase CoaBC [Candidatus Bathyarchaeota archaeon]MBT4320685.1 bifunctional phosphopantothenoylcysteine decarboxylase/phosphopantothenate--cysteine ligase CoaBC [Candidatus Bathyarchaeota archaeon]MBT4423739.1 bifunctional phosphopantothenoylcysteine decarboxylase/phosphopantothenate--cysteine ligase CoaBC [Candidatus Bathyarchaeota archaeon]MBT6605589.1 bifunctional phosphopantothenoylcysteine decarboxylase/p
MAFGEHSSKGIIGTKSKELAGKRIILCITGSVAAIKSPEIARDLMRRGADVYAVMSKSALHIIHPDMVEWATGNPVVTELTGQIEHVLYAGEHPLRADLILVAPSTANTIGKVACGIDDSPVTTTLTTGIGAGIPVIIAPAMHASMYKHSIVIENIEKLQRHGINVLMPRFEEGKAKIPGTAEIVHAVVAKLNVKRDLIGKRVLVTGGPTRAYLDAFRYITNPSSGKMGVALAQNALDRGAEVTLVYGPGSAKPPVGVKVVNIVGTDDMLVAVQYELGSKKYDTAILSAAAADYGASDRKMEKTPSGKDEWVIQLKPLPKVIENVKKIDADVFLVGFKAEFDLSNEELIQRSYDRMVGAGMDLIVANDVSRKNAGFGTDTNEVFIIGTEKQVLHVAMASKYDVASKILDSVIEALT